MTFNSTQSLIEHYEYKDALAVCREESNLDPSHAYPPLSSSTAPNSAADDTPGILSRIGSAIAPWIMAPMMPLTDGTIPYSHPFIGGDPEIGMALWGLGWSLTALERSQGQREQPDQAERKGSSAPSSSIERKRWESSGRGF